MRVLRWVLLTVLGAFVWAWYRVRSSSTGTQYTGSGSIESASDRRETAFRAQLTALRERYAEEAGWREQFAGSSDEEESTVLTSYVELNDVCSPTGATATALIAGQDTQVVCRRPAFSSVSRWSF